MNEHPAKDNAGLTGGGDGRRGSGATVFLAVSGSSVARDLMAVILKRNKFNVEVAATPEEAAARLRAGRFTAALLDMRIDGQLDYEVLAKFRSADSEVRLVVLADEGDAEIAERAAAVRADVILARPFDGDALIRTLRASTGSSEEAL